MNTKSAEERNEIIDWTHNRAHLHEGILKTRVTAVLTLVMELLLTTVNLGDMLKIQSVSGSRTIVLHLWESDEVSVNQENESLIQDCHISFCGALLHLYKVKFISY